MTFTGCITGQATINGGLTVTLDGVIGDPQSENYTLQTTLTSINLTIVDSVGTSTMAGGMHFQRVAAGGTFTELAQSIDTPVQQAFTWSESSATINRTHVIGPFTVSATVTNTSFSLGSTTDTLTVDSGLGPLAVTIAQPLQGGASVTAPTSGVFKVIRPTIAN